MQAQRFDDGNDFQSQEQEPYQEVGIADSAANQSASAAFQRSKSEKQPLKTARLVTKTRGYFAVAAEPYSPFLASLPYWQDSRHFNRNSCFAPRILPVLPLKNSQGF